MTKLDMHDTLLDTSRLSLGGAHSLPVMRGPVHAGPHALPRCELKCKKRR